MKIKTTFITLLFLTLNIAYAQENKKGAIKTKDGFILYFNIEKNSYTLNLLGETDLSNYPIVKLNDKWFEINMGSKSEFGNTPKDILINFMNWEIDYLKNEFKKEIKSKYNFIDYNDMLLNFWQYNPPIIKTNEISIAVKTTYFIDFIRNDLVHRFSYSSSTGNELEAKQFLLKLVDGIHYYKSNIDLKKLQETVIQGKTYYNE